MFAVIKTGGKQYRVAADDVITVATLAGEPGDAVTFDEVLMVTGDRSARIGAPTVAGATVAATVVEHTRGPKVIAFKKRRRKNSRRKRGHRQEFTLIRITEILTDGAKPTKTARPKPERKPPPPPEADTESDEDEAKPSKAKSKASKAKAAKKPTKKAESPKKAKSKSKK